MKQVTPTQINKLKPNEVFVFGSNMKGMHMGGAARFAQLHFGAIWGQGVGMQGQSYAIPTLAVPAHSGSLEKLPLEVIKGYVDEFIKFAYQHQDLIFYVTPIGCGIAGFTEAEIAPLFAEACDMANVYLPEGFYDEFGVNENRKMMEKFVKINEEQLHNLIKEGVQRVLKEYYSEVDTNMIMEVLHKIEEAGTLCMQIGLDDEAYELNETYVKIQHHLDDAQQNKKQQSLY